MIRVVKYLMLGLINVYQIFIAPYLMMPCCRFEPSCSVYAKEAIIKYGVWKGGWLTMKRLLRCVPCGKSGYDPVP